MVNVISCEVHINIFLHYIFYCLKVAVRSTVWVEIWIIFILILFYFTKGLIMDLTTIILILIIVLQLVVLAVLYRNRSNAVDESDLLEIVRQFEATERRMYEGLRDLRNEQATLARAARLENQSATDRLSEQLDKRFDKIGSSTEKNLEQIRAIVDEKLNATLERRLGESFSLVSRRLEEVHRGLGEMQSLAGGIGDLKRILSNVKNRGIWGEMQLKVLLQDMLAPEQYAENVAVKPGSAERVEFALKLPGKSEQTVWLPVDAKFPQEDYQRLLEAREIVKIKVLKNCDLTAKEVANSLSSATNSDVVQVIGAIIILYKKSTRKNFKHIELP